MFSSAEKTTHTATAVQQKAQQQTFFRKAGEEMFFGENETSSFFGAPVQTKLSISSPDDPQEKEADEVADQVMRMPDVSTFELSENENEKIDKKEEEEEDILPKIETPAINRNPLKEESAKQNHGIIHLPRMPEDKYDPGMDNGFASEGTDTSVYRKQMNFYQTGIIQRSGRGPPGNSLNFGQSLSSSKGGGSSMSLNTLQFMGSRFNADFSGVRIHTGAEANSMTRQINAQAFAHGNDVYFNEGKYAPQTQSGGTLLAHELMHTIQQGAIPAIAPTSVAAKSVAGKNNLQRSTQRTRAPSSGITGTNRIESGVNAGKSSGENIQINPGENNEEKEIAPWNEIQAKSGLSSWHVDPSGMTDTNNLLSIQKSEEDKELQKKEDEQQEQEDEYISPKVYSIQTKGIEASNTTKVYSKQNNPFPGLENTIQTTQLHINNPLKTKVQAPVSAITEARGRGPPVQLKSNGPEVIQRSVLDDALAYTSVGDLMSCVQLSIEATSACLKRKARDVAMHIPGYSAMRVVLGSDPITGEGVERSGHNFIEAAFDIIPGGSLLYQKLQEQHQLDPAATWIDGKMATLENLVSAIFSRFESFWEELGFTDFRSPMEVMRKGAGIVSGFINKIIDFAVEAGLELLEMVKDFLLESLVEFIKEKTPVYPLLTVILGEDPITKEPIAPNGTNILNALLDLGGEEGQVQRAEMQETGTFDKVVGYIDEGIVVFGGLYDTIVQNFSSIWNLITIEALMEPTATFYTIYNIFAGPVSKVLDFVERVVGEMLKLIKDVLFKRISAEAKKVRGYSLVTIIIGKDPFTDKVVPRNAENLIHGFMGLMDGGEEQFQQMKESGAIARTVDKVNAAVDRLNMTPEAVIQLFIDLWNSFTFSDFTTPIPTFLRIIDTFGEPIGRLIAFVVEIVRIVVVAILELMNFPFDLINNIIARTREAFQSIKRDPIGFLKNLLRAIRQGFVQFFDNIVTHLINGVMGWLMSELREAGIPELTDFSLQGVISWVLEVLGISMDRIWEKLAAHPRIGPERVARLKGMINTLEGVWTFIKDVQERGIVVIWEKIQEQLSNLWNTVLDAVKSWVMQTIIAQVTVKLLGMLDPTGIMAVINSCIAIYKAVQSFIKYMREMLEVLNSFVNGVADIAKGNIITAATYLENTMGRAMPIVIGFLANQVGLGGIGKRVGEMIESVRGMVDNAITWLVNKAVDTGMDLLDRGMAMGRSAVEAVMGWARGLLGLQQPFTTDDGVTHRIYFELEGGGIHLKLNPSPAGDYEAKINEINLPTGAMVDVLNPISVPLKRKGEVVSTINVGSGNIGMGVLKNYALQVAQHLNGLINSHMRTSTDPSTQVKDETPDFSASLGGLSKITSLLLSTNTSGGPLPITPLPVYGGLVNGFAHSMDVKPVTKLGVPGTDVSVDSSVYQDLLLRRETPGGRSYYVAGHLLNDNVHGSGSTWQNLTLITQVSNRQHLDSVESKVKEALDKDLILHYKVDVEYSISRNDRLIDQIEDQPNWKINSVLNEKHKILEAEAHLPKKLNCTVKQIQADGSDLPTSDANYDSQYNITGGAGVINNFANVSQDSLDTYYLKSATAVTYKDLNTLSSEAEIAISSDPGLTWDSFYNNVSHKVSADNLTVTERNSLRDVFRKTDLISGEKTRIDNQMEMVNWSRFTAGRAAYSNGILSEGDISVLHDLFNARMRASKDFFISSLTNYVNYNLTDPDTAWGTFRIVQQLNERAYEYPPGNRHVILTESEIQSFRTNVFEPRILILNTNPDS